MKPAEVKSNIKAQAAMEIEWRRLRQVPRKGGKVGVWDEDAVQEWSSVRRDAQKQNTKANAMRKSKTPRPRHDPNRKYKGRAVFQGNNAWDEEGNWAVFQELGSCPATMEAARCADTG